MSVCFWNNLLSFMNEAVCCGLYCLVSCVAFVISSFSFYHATMTLLVTVTRNWTFTTTNKQLIKQFSLSEFTMLMDFPTHAVKTQPQHRLPALFSFVKTPSSIGSTGASFTAGLLWNPSFVRIIADRIASSEPQMSSVTDLSLSSTKQTRSPWYKFFSDSHFHLFRLFLSLSFLNQSHIKSE